MKRLSLATVLLALLAGGYYFRGSFFETQNLNIYQYTLYSGNLDELYRFEPVVEAQMRQLPVLQDVNSDLQVESSQTFVDRQKVVLPGITISFKLAPGVALGQAIGEIQDMERRLALPATITASFSMRSGR